MYREIDFTHHYPPRAARVHEACGAGACAFAAQLCATKSELALWIYHGHDGVLYSDGLGRFDIRDKLYFLNNHDAKSQLWCMEEALSSSSVQLVICERNEQVSFRDMRRLQLAAERGQATGIFITSERFASPATETRWLCEPIYDEQDENVTGSFQRWSLLKNKQGALGKWEVRWNEKTHRITLV